MVDEPPGKKKTEIFLTVIGKFALTFGGFRHMIDVLWFLYKTGFGPGTIFDRIYNVKEQVYDHISGNFA